MGIPRLSQDVTPYAESANLGNPQLPTTPPTLSITHLVIDGPSLIYHIYNAILRNPSSPQSILTSNSNPNLARLPAYAYINACLDQFLHDLTESGTKIQSIVFDGALPVAKRPTRLERLEKSRSGLDTYRKLWSQGGTSKGSDTRNGRALITDSNDVNALRKVLWNTSPSSTHQHLLPPPPYMVASAIEHLQTSAWSSITSVVPGEADSYCAHQAQATGAAVLSNDSDLLLYDLGPNGNVIMLKTLTREDATIQCMCLRPNHIAKQMGVASLLEFGFQRSRDSSATTSVVVQRTRLAVVNEHDPAWVKFRNEYRPPLQPSASPPLVKGIRDLDPRTSEIICSLSSHSSPNMYLPIVLEDPTRDAAWSYGRDIRQLAYSLLLSTHNPNRKPTKSGQDYNYVTEHHRKGPRIAETRTPVFSPPQTVSALETLIQTITYFLPLSSNGSTEPAIAEKILRYHLLSTASVTKSYIHAGKSYSLLLSSLYPMQTSRSVSTTTWEDLHFLASIQCALYSFRILRQVLDYTQISRTEELVRGSGNDEMETEIQGRLDRLRGMLAGMPCLADLFLDLPDLRAVFARLPGGVVAERMMGLVKWVDPDAGEAESVEGQQGLGRASSDIKGGEDGEWVDGTRKRKKRRTREAISGGELTAIDVRAVNPFALLDQDGDDSD